MMGRTHPGRAIRAIDMLRRAFVQDDERKWRLSQLVFGFMDESLGLWSDS